LEVLLRLCAHHFAFPGNIAFKRNRQVFLMRVVSEADHICDYWR